MGTKLCKLQCFVVWQAGLMLLGKKAWAIGALWMEHIAICSVLGQVVWQESLGHWCNMGGKHCNLQCFGASCLEGRLGPFMLHGSKTLLFSVFWGNLFGKKAWAGAAIWAENTVIFSVLGQVV